jgi:hypothetical protein
MHDLESFFWVLFWICIHRNGPGKDIGPTESECRNYESASKLAGSKKSVVDDEDSSMKEVLREAQKDLNVVAVGGKIAVS